MPYSDNDQLPPSIRHVLPDHAQDIFRESFNHAWLQYADDLRREQIAFRVAWAAVKKSYVKSETGPWIRRQSGSMPAGNW